MKVGTACPAFFCSCDGDLQGLCHGDDFCVVARQKQLQTFGKVLEKRFKVKQTGHIGFGVNDLQLGRMMEAAELVAHASVGIPSEPLNQDMDAQLRYLLVTLTSGPALQIIRQQPSGVQAFRDLARMYNPRSQARSLAQLQ